MTSLLPLNDGDTLKYFHFKIQKNYNSALLLPPQKIRCVELIPHKIEHTNSNCADDQMQSSTFRFQAKKIENKKTESSMKTHSLL